MPVRSMTGYGQAVSEVDGDKVAVEIRSVNHRFAEFQIRMPKDYSSLDDMVRQVLAKYISRGRCDIFVNVERGGGLHRSVTVDWNLLRQLKEVEDEARANGFLGPSTNWLMNEQVLRIDQEQVDADGLSLLLAQVVEAACQEHRLMREREGSRLQRDASDKLALLRKSLAVFVREAPKVPMKARTRLHDRIAELGVSVDADRIAAEVAVFAERASIDEEVIRLESHIEEFTASLAGGSPVGRRLDFIVQEMHREVNTIASKGSDVVIAKAVIDAKTVIEQLREQVQNIE